MKLSLMMWRMIGTTDVGVVKGCGLIVLCFWLYCTFCVYTLDISGNSSIVQGVLVEVL